MLQVLVSSPKSEEILFNVACCVFWGTSMSLLVFCDKSFSAQISVTPMLVKRRASVHTYLINIHKYYQPQMLHVWNIYLHLPPNHPNAGINIPAPWILWELHNVIIGFQSQSFSSDPFGSVSHLFFYPQVGCTTRWRNAAADRSERHRWGKMW